MKKIIFLFFALNFSLIFARVIDDEKFVVIDIDKVYKEFYKTKEANKEILNKKNIIESHIDELNNKLKDLNTRLNDISSNIEKINSSTETLASQDLNNLTQNKEEVKNSIESLKTELQKYEKDETAALSDFEKDTDYKITLELYTKILDFSKNNNYRVILDKKSTLFDDLDVTNYFLEEINKQ